MCVSQLCCNSTGSIGAWGPDSPVFQIHLMPFAIHWGVCVCVCVCVCMPACETRSVLHSVNAEKLVKMTGLSSFSGKL